MHFSRLSSNSQRSKAEGEKGAFAHFHLSQDRLTSGHFFNSSADSSADKIADGKSIWRAVVRSYKSVMTASTAAGCSPGGRRAKKRRAKPSADEEAILRNRWRGTA